MIFLRLSLISVINNEGFISSAVVCDLSVFKKKEMNSIAKDIFLEGMEIFKYTGLKISSQ